MANIREVARKKAPDGIAYEVRWVDAGKHRQRTFTVKREAERFALKVENTVAEGDTTAPLVKRTTTVAQIVERVMAADQHRLKPRSLHSSDLIYQARVLPKFGARRISTITHSELQTWVDELSSSGLAASTVRHAFQAMSKVCKRAIVDRDITHNPAYGVTMPRARTRDDFAAVTLTPKQIATLAGQFADEPPYGLLIRFLARTGLRAAEVAGLRVRDVDLPRKRVHVRQTLQRLKGKWVVGSPKSTRSTRVVEITNRALVSDLRAHLLAHPNSGDPEALFWPGRAPSRAPGAERVDYSRVLDMNSFGRNYLKPALVAAKLPPMRVHDFRHTAASIWLGAGTEPLKVSRRLGHGSVVVTDTIYGHLFEEDHEEETDRVEAFELRELG
ncbi:tyrosine-type recombinase/integrase [Pseudoclavibacter terrae]|uniref:tyrosine-type recombinase/integrase n=1 Tax=Pseudoclavibacter terrae TaxID=1530195 RepID=UPI00232E38C8|nr:site-specific integrase [Pseudoclavibacter terrae]